MEADKRQDDILSENRACAEVSERGFAPKRDIISRTPQHPTVGIAERQKRGWGLKPDRRHSGLEGGQVCVLFRP